jgi:hypothetical protein
MKCPICNSPTPKEVMVDGICPECFPFDEPSEDRMSLRYLKRTHKRKSNLGGREDEAIRDCR